MSNRSVRENLNLLIQTKEELKTAINIKGGTIDASTTFDEYASLIDDIFVGTGINWALIGFKQEPLETSLGYDYAKYMVDYKNEFSGISEHVLNVSNNSSLVYLPSCSKLGVDPNDISVLSFCNCRNLVYIEDKVLNTLKVKFNTSTFAGCVSLKYIPKLDISTYTAPINVYGLFANLYSLETIDPSNNTKYWYMPNHGMYRLFYNCYNLKTLPVIDCEKLPTSYCSLSNMFYNCKALTDVSIINSSNISTMYCMFYGCESLTTVPLFDTQNVTSFTQMFLRCYSLTTIPQFNTLNASVMNSMFYDCTALTTVPELNTLNVYNMSYMFYNCTALTTVEGLDFRSISSEANSRLVGTSYTNTSLRKLYIKNIGYSACTAYDFTKIQNWGINNSSILDASLSIYKSLVEDTSNRAAAGSSTVDIKLNSTANNALDNSIKAAICAKGYKINGTTYTL